MPSLSRVIKILQTGFALGLEREKDNSHACGDE
jgi:hypothetical protein